MRIQRLLRLHALALAAACHCGPAHVAAPAAPEAAPAAEVECPRAGDGAEPLDAAFQGFEHAYDAARYEEALACAREASRLAPDDPMAHLDRATALDALGHTELAQQAYDRALALAPDDPEALRAAADFLVRLGTDDALETAVLHARRARDAAVDAPQGAELAAIEAQAANILGRSAQALQAAESGLAFDVDNAGAALERAVALVELLRFDEARPAIARARSMDPSSARAVWYSGLLAERDGREAEAHAAFAEATRLDPEAYPAPPVVDAGEFSRVIADEVARLAEDARRDLAACRLSVQEVPDLADLRSGEPTLSPTIVGLFRPGEEGQPDAIVLYRRNMLRIAGSREQLEREVRTTLLHELGHRAGRDDDELHDRGL